MEAHTSKFGRMKSIRSGSRNACGRHARYRAVDGGALADSAIGRFGGSVGGQPRRRRGAPYRASSRIAGSGEHTRADSADGSDLFGAVGVRYAADLATSLLTRFPRRRVPIRCGLMFRSVLRGPSTSMSCSMKRGTSWAASFTALRRTPYDEVSSGRSRFCPHGCSLRPLRNDAAPDGTCRPGHRARRAPW